MLSPGKDLDKVVETGVQAGVYGMKTNHGCERQQLTESRT